MEPRGSKSKPGSDYNRKECTHRIIPFDLQTTPKGGGCLHFPEQEASSERPDPPQLLVGVPAGLMDALCSLLRLHGSQGTCWAACCLSRLLRTAGHESLPRGSVKPSFLLDTTSSSRFSAWPRGGRGAAQSPSARMFDRPTQEKDTDFFIRKVKEEAGK